MKKLAIILMIISLFCFSACSYSDPIINSLPEYETEELYTFGEFQDYTDYAKYTYESISKKDLVASEYFSEVASSDIELILKYIENFEGWVEVANDELKENYDFDKNIISENDFFHIKAPRNFDNYTVYYFDCESSILYYFHSNI